MGSIFCNRNYLTMDIQQYINFDKELLLSWNGSDSLFWDGFIWVATSTVIWIPVGMVLLYVIIKNNKTKEALWLIGMLALVIILADQISSGFCKPYFARFRPTRDPELMYLIDVVNGYRGGRYGFTSSHAANTFAIAIFLSLVIKSKSFSATLFTWAALNAYSRIYLGVHYPGDILFGTLTGVVVGFFTYYLYKYIMKHYSNQPRYISNRYTSSGYLTSDISLLVTVMILTFFTLIIMGMILAYYLNF